MKILLFLKAKLFIFDWGEKSYKCANFKFGIIKNSGFTNLNLSNLVVSKILLISDAK